MPEYLAPGVFVEETSFRSKSIEGVSTSTSAFVGPTRKGPVNSAPEVITSFAEFSRVFGGLENLSFSSAHDSRPDTTNYLAHGVQAFFNNGGKRLYVARVFVPRTDAGGNVISDGTGRALVKQATPGSSGTAGFVARMPGAGLNGTINVFEKRTPVSGQANLENAPQGSLLRVGGTPAGPARVSGGKAPFHLKDGDQLDLIMDSGPESIVFNGTAAEVSGDSLADPLDIPADTILSVTVNSGLQEISLPEGSTSLADLLETININLRHGYARLDGDKLVIATDRQGASADIQVAANATLGFAVAVSSTGSGNVADLEQVTVNEINTLLPPAVMATLSPDTGRINLVTTKTGETATLQVGDTPARTAMGLADQAAQGTAGNNVVIYEKSGSAWSDANGANLTITDNTQGDLLTLNIVMEDGDGTVVSYENLGFAASHPNSITAVLAENPSSLSAARTAPYALKISGTVSAHELHAALLAGAPENSFAVTGGNDGAEPVAATTISGAVSCRDALRILEEIDDIAIIAAPGHSAYGDFPAIQLALLSHAERMRYRIAVLDSAPGASTSQVRATRSRIDSKYGALYYPWVMVANPLARPGNSLIKKELALPPSGFIAGIYARTDTERGVWKAPANEVVRGALRFEREITHGQQEVLNPEGINCLRSFFGRGNRVWGARTVSSDPEWKYVNIRRYFIYLEHSIEKSTQWAVFEPNGLRLWANIKDTVSDFLYNEWRSGALAGDTPEKGYFVRCDRSTMTQNDLDNGRLICEIGVAALRPAEFVIFRIGQKTADADG